MLRRFGLAVSPRFLWECLSSPTVSWFPAPASSNPAGGFPALGFPVCFMSQVMQLLQAGRAFAADVPRCTRYSWNQESPTVAGNLVAAAKKLAARLPELPADDLRDLLGFFLHRVIMQESGIQVTMSRKELRQLIEKKTLPM